MQCKYCQAELAEENPLCPNCGGDNTPDVSQAPETVPPKKKIKPIQAIAASVVGLVLLVLLVQMVHYGVTGRYISFANNVYVKGAYTVDAGDLDSEAELAEHQKKMASVVATMGEDSLTNGQLQAFYWAAVNTGEYDISYTTPLSEQIYDADTGMTWEQHILEEALGRWKKYTLLVKEASSSGYTLPQAYQEQLDTFDEQILTYAQSYGYEDAASYVEALLGTGCTLEDYRYYVALYFTAELYLQEKMLDYEPTDGEMEAYFAANEDAFSQAGVTKESDKLLDIRHILIKPDGDTDEAWETCRVTAQGILDQWLAGEATEESFAQLAMEHSEDGSASSGGLYQEVYEGQMVTAFNDWCFDESRRSGDSGLVKTEYGYHVIYYVDGAPAWQYYSKMGVQVEKGDAYAQSLADAQTMKVNYRSIVLGDQE